MHTTRVSPLDGRRAGFTLVEIMIAVVIIGLLAAMAVPAFNLVRGRTYSFLINNDARQLAGAAQQYVTDSYVIVVPLSANVADGAVVGPLSAYVKKITRGTEVGDFDSAALGLSVAFTMRNNLVEGGAVLSFDNVGKRLE